jgi:hypothetical protein
MAVDKAMRMYTWSKTTGKLLNFRDLQGADHLDQFEIATFSKNDDLYKRNFFDNFQLLVSTFCEYE